MPSILGANSVSGYTISNSLRFNAADSPSLQKTFGSAGNQKTMTFSFWVKRSIVAEDFAGGGLVSCGTADGDEFVNNRWLPINKAVMIIAGPPTSADISKSALRFAFFCATFFLSISSSSSNSSRSSNSSSLFMGI